MSVQEELDELRKSVAECHLVAFADLDSQLVLVSSSATRSTRDTLDALCAEVASIFAVADAADGDSGLARSDTGLTMSPDGLSLFLRDAEERSEALCCVCAGTVDVDDLFTQSKATLTRILAGASSA